MASKIKDSLARQLRLPTKGFFGWIAFHLMERKNAGLEKVAARLAAIEPHHQVLELGFGPGAGITSALRYVKCGPGKVYGVDLYMVEKASARLRAPIQDGKVELRTGDVMDLPFDSQSFHRVFHCNCYYFWPSLQDASQEIYRVMKPGGLMVTVLSLHGLKDFKAKGFLKYGETDHVKYMDVLEATGFKDVRLEHFSKGAATYEGIFAHRPVENGTIEVK